MDEYGEEKITEKLHAVVYLKPKQLIIKDCTRRFVLKLYGHEASRGLFATAELLVKIGSVVLPLWVVPLLWPLAYTTACTIPYKP